ncbi:hypothetical protein ACMHYO_11460 [Allopusillimonas ginsengisoli]|uniref:hypothetical protein n=1 Tax=Allopusillimonas ginsengisoli TaxID=453575 RepID=UPI0039C1C180
MVQIRKFYDPRETTRRLNVNIRHPETLAGLAVVPYRQESKLIDYILQQWMIASTDGKPLEEAIEDGTLFKHIEQALHLAKEGAGQGGAPASVAPAPPGTSRSKPEPMRHATSDVGGSASASMSRPAASPTPSTAPEHETATETETPDTKPETGAETKHETPAAAVSASADEVNEPAENGAKSGDDDDVPPPPPALAAKLGGMFDD